MTKPKAKQPVSHNTTARRESGFLTCTHCALSIPYQGYNGQPDDERPKHRCVRQRGVQPFDTFSLKLPIKVRSLPE